MNDFASIRPATPADAASIARIHVETWRHAYRGIVPQPYLDSLSIERRTVGWEQNLQKTTDATLVAEHAGIVVGWVHFAPCRELGEETNGEIHALYVDPSAQRSGLGRALTLAAERRLTERLRGATRTTLWVLERNTPARRFYETLGYTSDGRAKTETIGGEPLVELRYAKPIAH